jgi:hypothetical protein
MTSSDDIRAVVEAQRRARHRREVERMAAASPVIKEEREVQRILDTVFGLDG